MSCQDIKKRIIVKGMQNEIYKTQEGSRDAWHNNFIQVLKILRVTVTSCITECVGEGIHKSDASIRNTAWVCWGRCSHLNLKFILRRYFILI